MLATEGTESGAEAWVEVGRGARACDLPALGGGEPPCPGTRRSCRESSGVGRRPKPRHASCPSRGERTEVAEQTQSALLSCKTILSIRSKLNRAEAGDWHQMEAFTTVCAP